MTPKYLGGSASALALDGGTLETTANFTWSRGVTFGPGGGTLDPDSGTQLTLSGVIGGSGGLTKESSGTVTLTGANTFTGDTTVVGPGTLALAATGSAAIAGNLVVSNGTAQLLADDQAAGFVTVEGGTFDLGAHSDAVAGVQLSHDGIISGSGVLTSVTPFDLVSGTVSAVLGGSQGVVVTGGAIVTLSGQNTYSGETVVADGTLMLGATNALPTGGTVQMGDAAIGNGRLELDGYDQTVAGLYGDAASDAHQPAFDSVTNSSSTAATLTIINAIDNYFAGEFCGNLAINKSGQGTFTAAGQNVNSGAVTVYDGTLDVAGGFLAPLATASLPLAAQSGASVADGSASPLAADAASGNPQITGNTADKYWLVDGGGDFQDGESLFTTVGSLDMDPEYATTLVSAPTWQEAVNKAFSGELEIYDAKGALHNTLDFPADGDGFRFEDDGDTKEVWVENEYGLDHWRI